MNEKNLKLLEIAGFTFVEEWEHDDGEAFELAMA